MANILQKITYPTKGYSLLEYEMNESDNMFSIYDSYKLNQGNGLRIKKQKNYNFNNDELSHTDYEYFFGKTPSPTQLFKKDYIKTFKRKDGSVMGYQGAKSHFVYMMSGSINSKYPLSTPPYTFYEKMGYQRTGKEESLQNGMTVVYYAKETQHTN